MLHSNIVKGLHGGMQTFIIITGSSSMQDAISPNMVEYSFQA